MRSDFSLNHTDSFERGLKKNQSTPRFSEHPSVIRGTISKRLGGIKGCKYKTSSWHLNRFPDADNIGSTGLDAFRFFLNSIMSGRSPPCYTVHLH